MKGFDRGYFKLGGLEVIFILRKEYFCLLERGIMGVCKFVVIFDFVFFFYGEVYVIGEG